MRVYSEVQEDNIRDESLLRDWIRSGFLSPDQRAPLTAGLGTNLRQVHWILRVVLFLFSSLIVIAFVTLCGLLLRVRSLSEFAVLFVVAAGASFTIAWLLAARIRLYRCGVEEALAILAICFAGSSAGVAVAHFSGAEIGVPAGMLAASAAAFAVYHVFGFRYALPAAAVLAAFAAYSLDAGAAPERGLSALIFAAVFFASSRKLSVHEGTIASANYAVLRAVALAGIYCAINVTLPGPSMAGGGFFWMSYGLVWILPAAGLWVGIREKDRLIIDVSMGMALATLLSNKAYLGWTRQAWDPMLLGILLMGAAIAIRRGLLAGDSGGRAGFTPQRLFDSDKEALVLASIASVAAAPLNVSAMERPPTPVDGGGRSGGGGASGSF